MNPKTVLAASAIMINSHQQLNTVSVDKVIRVLTGIIISFTHEDHYNDLNACYHDIK